MRDASVGFSVLFLVIVVGIIGDRVVVSYSIDFCTFKTASLVYECSFFASSFGNVGSILLSDCLYHIVLLYGMLTGQVILQVTLFV